jgi:N-acetyl-anhydromuramyl-L-alanine amidase AmpD
MKTIEPKGIVIHSMGEYIKAPDKVYYAKEWLEFLGYSIHGLIKPDGTYDKVLSSKYVADHAGVSQHRNLVGLNQHYLGLEVLVEGEHNYDTFIEAIKDPNTFKDEQYDLLVDVCKWWMNEFNIPKTNIVRHSDVSGDNIRGFRKGKVDPGSGFKWEEFKNRL